MTLERETTEVFPNGICGVTGKYLIVPTTLADAMQRIGQGSRVVGNLPDARRHHDIQGQPTWGLPHGVDPACPREAGWTVVIAAELATNQKVRDAVCRLLEHRRGDGGLANALTYPKGHSHPATWLTENGAVLGRTIEPKRFGYYVLLVGAPTDIPFELHERLAIDRAVGRLCLDNPDDYARYVEELIEHEESCASQPGIHWFGAEHDRATSISARHLIGPLALSERLARFSREIFVGPTATKKALTRLIRESIRGEIIFTATHGVGFPVDHSRQLEKQGALVCPDQETGTWGNEGEIADGHLFTASDVPEDASARGRLFFLFACFSGGTPATDRSGLTLPRARLAREPFVAKLPQALLARGALACIAHVDRAWACSFIEPDRGVERGSFENTLTAICEGVPVGHAMRHFFDRYVALSVPLAALIQELGNGLHPGPEDLKMWMQRNDAGGYIVLGDPAARALSPKAMR